MRGSPFHQARSPFGDATAGERGRNSRSADRAAEHVLQRAGEQDHQALDDDDHVAADRRHLEGELGAALVEHAEQDAPPGTMPAGCERPISATAMPTKPAPATKVELQACWSPITGLSAIMPASAPEISMVTTMMRVGCRHSARRGLNAHGADLVAEPGAPDQHPDQHAGMTRASRKEVRLSGAARHGRSRTLEQPAELGQLRASAKCAFRAHHEPGASARRPAGRPSALAAMKLNMMVVMTMWLPRLACSQAGISAQAAPKAAAARWPPGRGQPPGQTRSRQADQRHAQAAEHRPGPRRRC
jgi:hypothetical protein